MLLFVMKQTCTAVALHAEVLRNQNYQFPTLQIEFCNRPDNSHPL